MLKRGPTKADKRKAMSFVAPFFGHEAISVKYTTNADTFRRAFKRGQQRSHGKVEFYPYELFAGAFINLDNKGRKSLVFINKQPTLADEILPKVEQERHLTHELTHAFYFRRQKMLRRKVYHITAELLSQMIDLEFARVNNPFAYKRDLSDANMNVTQITTDFADGIARTIHRRFSLKERQVLFNEILDKKFTSRLVALNWLQNKLRQYRRRDLNAETQITDFQRNHDIYDSRRKGKITRTK